MSGEPMALPTPEGTWEIIVNTRTVVSCADRKTAMRLCRLIQGDYTDLPRRPRALSTVQCFETAAGPVEVVVGTKTVAHCSDWAWARHVTRLIEVDAYKRLLPWEKTNTSRLLDMVAPEGGDAR